MSAAPATLPRGVGSLAGTALAAVLGLWFGAALFGPWAFVQYLADLYSPKGGDLHFQAMLTALTGLGDFGALLAGWLQLLAGG